MPKIGQKLISLSTFFYTSIWRFINPYGRPGDAVCIWKTPTEFALMYPSFHFILGFDAVG